MSQFADAVAFKQRQMEFIAEREHLETEADLDAFLDRDSKTKNSPEMRTQWKAWLQAAVPKLKAS